jgi:outer membrane immunogenic protein
MTLKTLAAAGYATLLLLAATPVVAQPNPPVDPWAGLYIGIGGHAGIAVNGEKLGFQDQSAAHDLVFGTNNEDQRFIGGAQLGQLWRVGGMALGIEDDVSFAKDIKYLETLRAVVGVPAGPFLIYGTGGLAVGKFAEEFSVTSPEESGVVSGSVGRYGWTAGGGIEALVTPHLSLGVEGLYYGMGQDTSNFTTPLGEQFAVTADRNFAVVRARLDFHFTSWF